MCGWGVWGWGGTPDLPASAALARNEIKIKINYESVENVGASVRALDRHGEDNEKRLFTVTFWRC